MKSKHFKMHHLKKKQKNKTKIKPWPCPPRATIMNANPTPSTALGEKRKCLKKVCEMLPALSQSPAQLGACSPSSLCSASVNFPPFTLQRLFPLRRYPPLPSAELAFSSFRVQVKCHFHRKHFLTSDQLKSPYCCNTISFLGNVFIFIFRLIIWLIFCLFRRIISSRRTGTL